MAVDAIDNGALKKTLHARVLLEDGIDLLLCLNPLVPFDATHGTRHRVRQLAEHAYQKTQEDLRSRRSSIGALLATHGLALDEATLDDRNRRLVQPHAIPRSSLAQPLQRRARGWTTWRPRFRRPSGRALRPRGSDARGAT